MRVFAEVGIGNFCSLGGVLPFHFLFFGVVYNIIMLLSNILYTVIILCVRMCAVGYLF